MRHCISSKPKLFFFFCCNPSFPTEVTGPSLFDMRSTWERSPLSVSQSVAVSFSLFSASDGKHYGALKRVTEKCGVYFFYIWHTYR